jgi:ParB-like chromosome segregation protein Spo0J
MKTVLWDIDKLTPYARNPRKNDAAVDKVAASLKEFGWRQPIVVDSEGVIIAGHTRYKAARKLGMDKVPVHVADNLTPAQIKAYRIADNKVGELAEWDMELLALEIEDLKDVDYDVGLTGFDEGEMSPDQTIAEAEIETLLDQSLQLEPDKEYVLVMAKDRAEWDQMVEYFRLKKVRRGGYKKGSAFDAVGTERVLTFERVKNAHSDSK